MGSFHTPLDAGQARNYLGFAGGSGITPVLSILKTTLRARAEQHLHAGLCQPRREHDHVPRGAGGPQEPLHGAADVIHVLEPDAQEIDLFTGRVDAEKCDALFRHWIDIGSVDTAFICGPEPMMLGIAAALRAHGLDDAQIKFELFASAQPGRLKRKARPAGEASAARTTEASVTLDGVDPRLHHGQGPDRCSRRRWKTPSTRPCLQGRGLLDLPLQGARGRGRDGRQPRAGGLRGRSRAMSCPASPTR